MEDFYEELKGRYNYLSSQVETEETKIRKNEVELAIVRVQQILLANIKKPKQVWVCNECNCSNFTESVSETEIELELHSCINCGGFEFHLENIK